MMADVWINDRPLDDLVYQVLALDGHLAPNVAQHGGIAMVDAPAVLGSNLTVRGRRIVLDLDVRPADIEARTVDVDALRRRLAGLLEFRSGDAPDLYTGAHANPLCHVQLLLDATDGARRDVEPLGFALSTTRQPLPVGSLASGLSITINGGCTDPEIIIRNFQGVEVSRLELEGVLATNDALDIETNGETIDRYVAGVLQTGASAGLAWFAAGPFPLLSEEDAAPETEQWATIELTSAAGTPTGSVSYHRAN
jgi:hypothetical protein